MRTVPDGGMHYKKKTKKNPGLSVSSYAPLVPKRPSAIVLSDLGVLRETRSCRQPAPAPPPSDGVIGDSSQPFGGKRGSFAPERT